MHCRITPTKTLALNSCCCCCSLKCNAFTLCIHTRAGCLGDTQNGRTYVTKCWRNDESTDERGEMNCRSGVCEEEREHKKANGRWARRDGTRLQYIQRPLGLSASKGTKHIQRKRHARTHCQHASSVEANSQNRVVQPRHCTQASYSSTLSLQPRSRLAFHCLTSSATHRDKDSGLWCTVTVQTPMRTDENKANSTHSR